MKRILLNIFLILSVALVSQNNTIDSLKKALMSAINDTTKVKTLLYVGEQVYLQNPDSAMTVWKQAQQIAELNLNSKKLSDEENKFHKMHLGDAFNNIALLLLQKGDVAGALDCYEKCLKIDEEIGDKWRIAYSLNGIGFVYKDQGLIRQALSCFERSLKIRKELGDKKGIANTLAHIGDVYHKQADIPKALEYYRLSLKLYEEIDNKLGIANTLNLIGVICQNIGDNDKALEHWLKCLNIREKIGDKKGIAATLNNIGYIYKLQKNYTGAIESCNKSLAIQEEIKDMHGIAYSLNAMGVIYQDQGDVIKATEYFEKGLKIREEIGDQQGISNSLNNLASVYLQIASKEKSQSAKKDNYKKALGLVNRSMEISKQLAYPSDICNAAEKLKIIHQSLGNSDLALENYELYILMRDSINNEKNKKASIKSQLKYEYDKKAAADSVKASEEKKVVEAQLKQEKTQRFALYGGLGLVGIFALFMVNRFRVTNKQKKLIEEQKLIVETQKYIVEEKQKEILDSIKYAKRIQNALITSDIYFNKELKRLRN